MGKTTPFLLAVAGTIPAFALRLTGTHLGTLPDTILHGLAIVAAAFILGWVAEAAELEIPQALALAALALIAVLPEYAVDLTFAWKAGQDPTFAPYAVANMTGSNRLLIGVGWASVILVFWWRQRRRVLHLDSSNRLEIGFLALATVYSFLLPLKGSISLVDMVVLVGIFAAYLVLAGRQPHHEPELMGPAEVIGALPRGQRRLALTGFFAIAGGAILAAAEPFAEGLVESGKLLNIDEFLLVQWLAPLASESPEFLVALILAWRGKATQAMGVLLSSKVNQWTLLIGTLPAAYGLSAASVGDAVTPLPLDQRQTAEVFLTAAQSALAVMIVANLRFSVLEGLGIALLFFGQFIAQGYLRAGLGLEGMSDQFLVAYGWLYLALTAGWLAYHRSWWLAALRRQRARFGKAPQPPTSSETAAARGLAPGEEPEP